MSQGAASRTFYGFGRRAAAKPNRDSSRGRPLLGLAGRSARRRLASYPGTGQETEMQ